MVRSDGLHFLQTMHCTYVAILRQNFPKNVLFEYISPRTLPKFAPFPQQIWSCSQLFSQSFTVRMLYIQAVVAGSETLLTLES